MNNDNEEGGRNTNLPYIKWTKLKIEKNLRKGNIKVSFSSTDTLRKMLDHAKYTINPRLQSIVYTFPMLM
jgi:hypothetical protein